MTERFSKEAFEAALPKHKVTGAALWQGRGLDKGEFTYFVPVTSEAGILIRSSVDASGFAASTGEDSIRLVLVNPVTGEFVGGKLSRWTTRVKGWEGRLVDQLRIMFQIAKFVRPCACGETVRVMKVRKEGDKKGFVFASCSNRNCTKRSFTWVADNKLNLIPHKVAVAA